MNTIDDGPLEQILLPGPDGIFGTADDEAMTLAGFTRQIEINDINQNLREIRVVVTYSWGSSSRVYVLSTYISSFA